MAKARRKVEPPAALPGGGDALLPDHLQRPFFRAAMSARFIGVAAVMLGGLTFFAARRLPPATPPAALAAYACFALLFLLPGVLYVVLAAFVSRRRGWAIKATFVLASLDMTLLGIVIVTLFNPGHEGFLRWLTRGDGIVSIICGLFVVALAVLTTYLGRSLDALRRGSRISPIERGGTAGR